VRKSLPLFVNLSFLAGSLSAGTIRGLKEEVVATAPSLGARDVSSVRAPTTLRLDFQKNYSRRSQIAPGVK
jgi:hypothetical protein